jgi:hypothetical protein
MNPYRKTPSIVSAQLPAGVPVLEESIAVTVPQEIDGDALESLANAVFDETGLFIGDNDELLEAEGEEKEELDFDDNLAEELDPAELTDLGSELVKAVEDDDESRSAYYTEYVKGITALGINFDKEAQQSDVFGSINHPLLIEAATQFQARAMSELYPATGPVKAQILGKSDNLLVEQAGRVQDYMNYQLMTLDKTYFAERDQMLFVLPFSGSEFDKQYYDKSTKKVVSRWVRCENMIVNYGATNFESCPRYAERIKTELNDIKRLQARGHYRNVALSETDEDQLTEVGEKIAKIDGVEIEGQDNGNTVRTLYEIHVDLNLAGFEDEDGINLPYIVTVDKDSKQVLSIYRNWAEGDELKIKRVWFTHKKFLPGFGFYGFGLFHTIGSLGEVATKIIQLLLDAGAFSALQGGYKSKDAKLPESTEIIPGKWQDTELTADELAKAFYTPPFREPSSTLFNLLGAIVELGRRFAATTEVMVGDAATTGPVGTTVALVEQGSKVFSGIHKRLHNAIGIELQHIADLNFEQLPEEEYPYSVSGEDKAVFKSDFDGRVDIVPVSDPNIFSSAQRIAMSQAVFQIATQMPDIADRRKAAVALLTAMRVPNSDEIFPEPQEAVRADPVTEGAAVAVGKPIKAFLEQNHQAHIMVHMGMMQMQMLPPQVMPILQAHIAEHMAMQMFMQMQQTMQMPLPPVNWGADKNEQFSMEIPPQAENMIAMQSAQAMQQMMAQQQQQMAQQQQQGKQGQQPPADPAIAAQINAASKEKIETIKASVKGQDLQVKAGIAQVKETRAQNEFMQEMALRGAEFQHQREMDIATFRQAIAENTQQSQQAIKSMLDEFRHEMALKQVAGKEKET